MIQMIVYDGECYKNDFAIENKEGILKILTESKKGPTIYKGEELMR